MKYNYVIVGAGLSGCVLASVLAKNKNKSVLIIEKRNHIAGNCFDYQAENGIYVHQYGPHIFHTNNEQVWNFLSQHTEWINYKHHVLAVVNNTFVPVPFNFISIKSCFEPSLSKIIISKLKEKFPNIKNVSIFDLLKEEDEHLKNLANFVYEKIFLGYTIKQWGLSPDKLEQSVIARIPINLSEYNGYFTDKYQGIPKNGYTELVKNLITKHNIKIILNQDFLNVKFQNSIEFDYLFYTGMIDEYYNYCFGKLPYRSLKFDFETITNKIPFQPVAQVNYPSDNDYTRITEFLHFQNEVYNINNRLHSADHNYKKNVYYPTTVIAKEYPIPFFNSKIEIPYYPIPQKQNFNLFQKYINLPKKDNIIFFGRLADYNYYNMDQAILRAMFIGEKFI